MKKINFAFLFLIIILSQISFQNNILAQTPHSQWSISSSTKEAKVGDIVEIIYNVSIEDDWYLYGSNFGEGGPQITSIKAKKDPSFELVGKLESIGFQKKFDTTFEMDITIFKKKAEFRQKIKILAPNTSGNLNYVAEIDFQVCSDKEGTCKQGTYKSTLNTLKIAKSAVSEEKKNPKIDSNATNIPQKVEDDTNKKAQNSNINTNSNKNQKDSTNKKPEIAAKIEAKPAVSLLSFLIIAFGGGLLALLTPCVFPMIPMTVSIFMKDSAKISPEFAATLTPERLQIHTQEHQRKVRRQGITKALVYGLAIIAIYTLIGAVVSAFMGVDFTNDLSTSATANIIFFCVFIFFALSFLGMFELVLPGWLVNKIDEKADQGGYLGVFFMAFTLVLVSFSCTAPIAGTLILAAFDGEILRPALGMMAFSSAFAIPFVIFAIFPSLLKSLPKSGGWLNVLKVVLGFVELALAFKFLSTADLAYHWGILDRDEFLTIWIVIFGVLGLYLLGKISLPHDSKVEKISVPRLLFGMMSMIFSLYMLPGLFGSNLALLSGIIPPQTTNNFDLDDLIKQNAGNNSSNSGEKNNKIKEKIKYSEFLKLPLGIEGFFDYEQGLAYAKKVNKPVFLDFTGHGCANCRKMEENVWVNPKILEMLKNDYVVISLYVDDKTELPENEHYKAEKDGEIKTTLGKKNFFIQIDKYQSIAQPYYCLLDTNGNLMVQSEGYNADIENFNKFLEKGLVEFKKT